MQINITLDITRLPMDAVSSARHFSFLLREIARDLELEKPFYEIHEYPYKTTDGAATAEVEVICDVDVDEVDRLIEQAELQIRRSKIEMYGHDSDDADKDDADEQ